MTTRPADDARLTGRCGLCGAYGVRFRLTVSQTGAYRQVLRRVTEVYVCPACAHAMGAAMAERERLHPMNNPQEGRP